jgi:tetratricopeptide (TPR) repeat protein
MLFARRRYAESIAVLEHALARDTMWSRTHVALGRSYLAVGRYDEAIRQLRRTGYEFAAFEPSALLANALGVAGHRAEARRMVDDLEARARGSYVRPVDLVAAHLGLGDTARALDWAERIPDDRGSMSFLLGDPMFDTIRQTPRFTRVLERMGLGDAARRQR